MNPVSPDQVLLKRLDPMAAQCNIGLDELKRLLDPTLNDVIKRVQDMRMGHLDKDFVLVINDGRARIGKNGE